jgi:phospholipase C
MKGRILVSLFACAAATSILGFATSCDDTVIPNNVPTATGLNKLNQFVVIYLENHSFDNLYGKYAGAEGIASATDTVLQIDTNGNPYQALPQPFNTSTMMPDPDFPTDLPNAPFNIDMYKPANMMIPDLVHRYYQEQSQIDGGRMDKYAQVSNAKGLVMGYYDTSKLPLATYAKDYTVCDYFFHSAFGGSFLNHIFLISAAPPSWPNAPMDTVAQFDPMTGKMTMDGQVTPDGYAVNTSFSVNAPHPTGIPMDHLLPNQTLPTIGDRLNDAKVSWAWYSGGYNDALAGNPDPSFQFHHQPFIYFQNYADGTDLKKQHLKDETDFMNDAKNGKLPAVSFVKPIGDFNEHPGYADVTDGENHVLDLIKAVKSGPQWKDTAIIITYDENGGFWDHVPPPKADRWGPGTRVPTIVISPFSKKGVDHTKYETLSILTTLEHRFQLPPLTDRDAHAADMSPAFSF